jgi:hypothetical protein
MIRVAPREEFITTQIFFTFFRNSDVFISTPLFIYLFIAIWQFLDPLKNIIKLFGVYLKNWWSLPPSTHPLPHSFILWGVRLEPKAWGLLATCSTTWTLLHSTLSLLVCFSHRVSPFALANLGTLSSHLHLCCQRFSRNAGVFSLLIPYQRAHIQFYFFLI